MARSKRQTTKSSRKHLKKEEFLLKRTNTKIHTHTLKHTAKIKQKKKVPPTRFA